MIRLTASSPRSKLGARAALANRLRATSWSVTRALGLLGIASVSIWCASTDDPAAPPPDPPVTIPDSGTPDVAPDRSTPPASSCAGSFCRIDLPGIEAIALNGVWARSATDVWIVGSSGYAARWNGTAWNRITTGTKQTLFAVWGSDEGVVWATSSGRSFFDLSGATDAGAPAADAGFKGIVRAIGGAVRPSTPSERSMRASSERTRRPTTSGVTQAPASTAALPAGCRRHRHASGTVRPAA